jgi:hypothetical protein
VSVSAGNRAAGLPSCSYLPVMLHDGPKLWGGGGGGDIGNTQTFFIGEVNWMVEVFFFFCPKLLGV